MLSKFATLFKFYKLFAKRIIAIPKNNKDKLLLDYMSYEIGTGCQKQ